MGVFPSGQWGQTVNLLLSASVVRIHPRPPRTPVSEPGTGVSVLSVLQKGLQGWIRTAAATSLKTAQKQSGATATTAASGRSREELLGLRLLGAATRVSFLFCAARGVHPVRRFSTPLKNGQTKTTVRVDGGSVIEKNRQGAGRISGQAPAGSLQSPPA